MSSLIRQRGLGVSACSIRGLTYVLWVRVGGPAAPSRRPTRSSGAMTSSRLRHYRVRTHIAHSQGLRVGSDEDGGDFWTSSICSRQVFFLSFSRGKASGPTTVGDCSAFKLALHIIHPVPCVHEKEKRSTKPELNHGARWSKHHRL